MINQSSLRATLAVLASSAAIFAGCGSKNAVAEGDPIPNTKIVSCGDALIGEANPAGGLDATLTVAASTVLAGSVIWQASCPHEESKAETEFVFEKLTLYRDDAGFPGATLDSAPFDLRGTVSCADRVTTQIGGASKSQTFGPSDVFSLSDLCAERAKMPTGSPLYVQVEMEGHATTCSSVTTKLLFRSKVGVECPKP